MYLTTTPADLCWICGSPDSRIYRARNYDEPLRPTDVAITDSRFGLNLTLVQCLGCGFIHAACDEVCELNHLYEELTDPSYEEGQDVRAHQMCCLLEWIKDLHPAASTLLDIGAGAGALVRHAHAFGLEALGIEPSRSLALNAERLNHADVRQGFFPHSATCDRQFDVITLVDVIEHVPDPMTLLRSAAAALAPNGLLLVVTPDIESLPSKVMGRRWWHVRLAHVGYFSADTLIRAGRNADLAPIDVRRPCWFFKLDYLAARVAKYLPAAELVNNVVRQFPGGDWLYSRLVPLNLRDSLAVFFKARCDAR